MSLQTEVEILAAPAGDADKAHAREIFAQLRSALSAGSVCAAGSTPIYDPVKEEIITPTPERPLIVPPGAVVVPGARAVSGGKGPEWGLSLATPVIVKYRDSRTDTRTELEAWIR